VQGFSSAGVPPLTTLTTKVIPVLYMVGMAGCLCFFSQLRNKRRLGKHGNSAYK
jgi:hypothetical protein